MEFVRADDFSTIFTRIAFSEFSALRKRIYTDEAMTLFAQALAPFFDVSPNDVATASAAPSITGPWHWIKKELQITTQEETERLLDLMQPLFAKKWDNTKLASELLCYAEIIVPPRQMEPRCSSDEIRLVAHDFVSKEMKPILAYLRPESFLDTLAQVRDLSVQMTEVPFLTIEMIDFAREVTRAAGRARITTEPRDLSYFVAADTRTAHTSLLSPVGACHAMTMGLQAIGYVSTPQHNRVNAKWSKKLRKHFGVLPLRLLLT